MGMHCGTAYACKLGRSDAIGLPVSACCSACASCCDRILYLICRERSSDVACLCSMLIHCVLQPNTQEQHALAGLTALKRRPNVDVRVWVCDCLHVSALVYGHGRQISVTKKALARRAEEKSSLLASAICALLRTHSSKIYQSSKTGLASFLGSTIWSLFRTTTSYKFTMFKERTYIQSWE